MHRSGKKDRHIIIERLAVVENAMGGRSKGNPVKVAEAWADVNYGTANERRVAGQEASALTATFRIDSTTKTRTIAPKDQLRIKNEPAIWDIVSVVPYGLNKSIDITAKRIN